MAIAVLPGKQHNHFCDFIQLKNIAILGSAVSLPSFPWIVTVVCKLLGRTSLPFTPIGLTRSYEGVATLRQDLHEVVGEVSASQVQTHDGVGQGIALVDGHVVGDTISGVQHNAWGTIEHNRCHNNTPHVTCWSWRGGISKLLI